MTLASSIIIVDPVDARALFDFGLELLAQDPTVDWEPRWSENKPSSWGHYRPGWRTQVGQGLPAIFDVDYGDALTYYGADDYAEFELSYRETLNPDNPDELPWWNTHVVSVGLDTAYGYDNGAGGNCVDLHAYLIRELGAWIDAQPGSNGLPWPRWVWNMDSYSEWTLGWVDNVHGDADRGDLRKALK